jgi:AcrR family transcriptional regulator
MPRTEEANQRIREEQRTRILEAALTVFARRGMEATIADVAAAADVSYGLVYRYFASKEALLVELVEQVLSESLRTLQRALETPGTPGERLRSLLSQILQSMRERPEFILLVQQVLGEEARRDYSGGPGQKPGLVSRIAVPQELHSEISKEHLRKLAQEQSRTYRAVLRQLIVEGQTTGEIASDDPDQLVAAITACVAGLSRSAIWQTPQQFQRTLPAVAILFRLFEPQEKESQNV